MFPDNRETNSKDSHSRGIDVIVVVRYLQAYVGVSDWIGTGLACTYHY